LCLEAGPGPVESLGAQRARQGYELQALSVQDGRIGRLAVEPRILEVEGLATDDTATALRRQELLTPLEVGAVGAAGGKPPVRLVEGHPLAVLRGLALAGWERRQAFVV
jgi:hypothetical protein